MLIGDAYGLYLGTGSPRMSNVTLLIILRFLKTLSIVKGELSTEHDLLFQLSFAVFRRTGDTFVLLTGLMSLGDGLGVYKNLSNVGLKPLMLICKLSSLRTVWGIAVSLLGFAYPIRFRFFLGFLVFEMKSSAVF